MLTLIGPILDGGIDPGLNAAPVLKPGIRDVSVPPGNGIVVKTGTLLPQHFPDTLSSNVAAFIGFKDATTQLLPVVTYSHYVKIFTNINRIYTTIELD